MMSTAPSHKTDYERLWQAHWGDMQRYGPIHRHQRRLLRRLLRPLHFQSVLDLGCGEGSNLAHVLSAFPQVREAVGCDISGEALKQARAALPGVRLVPLDAQVERLDQRFDLIYSTDVIEHVADDQAFLQQAYAMTGRYFLVSSLQGRMRRFETSIGHLRNYRRGELQDKCQAAGFQIRRTVEWGWPLYSPLYRNLNDTDSCRQVSGGKYNLATRLCCHILYGIFCLNSHTRGDIVWVVCERPS